MLRSEMMERMPSSEFFEWMILETIEPFGDRRADIHAGMIQQLMANIHRGPHTQAYTLDQFLPQFVTEPKTIKPQTPEEQMAIWRAITEAQNASVHVQD